MNIAVVGLSHKTAPVEVREKLSIPEPQMESVIAHICSYPHVEEVAILSTCNRLEIYIVTRETELGIREVTQFLSEYSKLPALALRQHLFMLLHQDAVMHLMRVASGLDSLVLGEGQILAQVKQTHKLGQQHKGVKLILNRLFQQAVTAGKRVRSETSIGNRSSIYQLSCCRAGSNESAESSRLSGDDCWCWQNVTPAGATPDSERSCPNFNSESLSSTGRRIGE